MIERRLRRQLEEVARRYRQARAASWLAIAWIVLATCGAVMLSLNRSLGVYVRGEPLLFVVIGATVTAFVGFLSWRASRDSHWLARRIENRFPHLDARLLTAIEQVPELPDGRYSYLQQELIQETLSHGYQNDWRHALPTWRYTMAIMACVVAACAITLATVGLFRFTRPTQLGLAPLFGLRFDRPLGRTQLLGVEPGNVSIERSTSLLVLARFGGQLPAECDLLLYESSDDVAHQSPMPRSLDDPVFGGRIASVDQDLEYQVRYDIGQSPRYRITVFDFPALRRADAQLDFPAYTSLETTTIQDVRHITAVEGTELTLICHLNKPVVTAVLQSEAGEEVELQPESNDSVLWRASLTLRQSERWTLHLVDEAGRQNKQPAEFVVTVTRNQRPTVELVHPSRDVEVSPLEELQLTARVWDDYEVARCGVTFQVGDQPEQEVVLEASNASKEKTSVDYLVQFEDLDVQPAQLFTYHFWAEDGTLEGKSRRSVSHLYFAEVRPFEEIFRQGQQPPGDTPDPAQQPGQQPGGEGGQAEQLAEAQKEIISATWNVLRTELEETPSGTFADDVRVILTSQSALIDKLQAFVQQTSDAASQSHAGQASDHMQAVVDQLTRAADETSREALREAIAPAQAAYQTLLKLRAREHEVIRRQRQAGEQSGRGGAGSSRAQQQLQQLALSNDQNRYETERQAAEPPDTDQQRDRQVLNRLRELARRQNDLNERLKEVQAELQQAQTEPEREELRKQLKRLREQQEEILRDTDELASRVRESPDQAGQSDAQQRLDQARENVRRASQALEEGQISQALTSGSRAQRELDELREEYRRKTSDRFADQARELTRQAEELATAERQLAETLNQDPADGDPAVRSLRENSPREQVLEELQRQNERLEELLQNVQTTVKDAEEAQPLLAEQLYDSYRRARQERLAENLQETRQSLQRGLVEDARQLERTARQSIERLRDDVQQAAESVLGDENEALQRARDELDTLSQQLDREIRAADPTADTENRKPQPGAEPAAESRDARVETGSEDPRSTASSNDNDLPPEEPSGRDAASSGQGEASSGRDEKSSARGEASSGRGDEPSGRGEPSSGREGASSDRGEAPSDRRIGGEGSSRGNPSDEPRRLRGGPEGDVQRGGGPEVGERRPDGPLTGTQFREWLDRLRDVEEMIGDSELRQQLGQVRDRARAVRTDLIRHSQEPNWDLVRMGIARPLQELRERLDEELQRRASRKALVPIDRDAVPTVFEEQVRRYYERIGSGQ
ncbi:MAG: hypothetical protein ACYC0X_27000 [Pirellulaceae bacterium]